jgi:hypothetical protein
MPSLSQINGKGFFYVKKTNITMLGFRSELENLNNPVVEKDIIDLAEIRLQNSKIFKSTKINSARCVWHVAFMVNGSRVCR